MKKIFTLLIGIVFSITILNSQAPPQAFSYKATFMKANGNAPLSNKTIGLKIKILKGEANELVYSETFKPTTNKDGQIDIVIGRNPDLGYKFSEIKWAEDIFFLQVWVDINGGTVYGTTPMSTTQLLSVPYALYAGSAGSAGSAVNESDPIFKSYPAYGITSGDITNWNNPDWSKIKNTPTTISGYGITDAVKVTDDQTIEGNKTFSGTTTVQTPVNASDAATKAYVDELKSAVDALTVRVATLERSGFGTSTVTDIDGNVYNTLTIGSQTWMAENLKTTKYSNRDPIGTTIPATLDISKESTPKYQWAYNGDESNVSIYGRLYTWYAATDTRNICPTNWHLPSEADWLALVAYLEGYYNVGLNVVGGKLKEIGTFHWAAPNTGATNETGFTALPGGERYNSPESSMFFLEIGYYGNWWASNYKSVSMNYINASVFFGSQSPIVAYSVRCLKDN